MNEPSTTIDKILEIISTHRLATRAEIRDELERTYGVNLTKTHLSAFLTKLNTPRARTPKRIYIKDYVYDAEGERCYPRPQYAIGSLKDKPRPGNRAVVLNRQYRAVKRRTPNSVFALGAIAARGMTERELAEALG